MVVPEGEANFKASNNGKSIYAVNGKVIKMAIKSSLNNFWIKIYN